MLDHAVQRYNVLKKPKLTCSIKTSNKNPNWRYLHEKHVYYFNYLKHGKLQDLFSQLDGASFGHHKVSWPFWTSLVSNCETANENLCERVTSDLETVVMQEYSAIGKRCCLGASGVKITVDVHLKQPDTAIDKLMSSIIIPCCSLTHFRKCSPCSCKADV